MNNSIVKELDLVEFRGIRRVKKPLKLSNFTVLIGRNNAGKTAVLEAIYLLLHPFKRGQDPILEEYRFNIVSEMHSGGHALVYGYSGTAHIHGVIGKNKVRITYSIQPSGAGFIKVGGKPVDTTTAKETLCRALEIKRCNYKQLAKASLLLINDTYFIEELRKRLIQPEIERSFVKKGLHSKIVKELVNPVVHDTYTEFIVKGDSIQLRKSLDGDVGPLYIDVRDLGDGLKKLILYALAIEYFDPKIILWDDFEASAHPGMLEVLLKWLASSNRQVVIATHSLDVLYHLAYLNSQDGSVILLSKDENDVLSYRAFTIDELEDLLDRGLDPRKLAEVLEL